MAITDPTGKEVLGKINFRNNQFSNDQVAVIIDRVLKAKQAIMSAHKYVNELYWSECKKCTNNKIDNIQREAMNTKTKNAIAKWFNTKGVTLSCEGIDRLRRVLLSMTKILDGSLYIRNESLPEKEIARYTPAFGIAVNSGEFWTTGEKLQISTIIHESSHQYYDTEDHGYWNGGFGENAKYSDIDDNPVEVDTAKRLDNASTIEHFIMEFY